MGTNPFDPDTIRGRTFAILADGEWHCAKCELPSSQPAKDVQQIKQRGYKVDKSQRECAVCGRKTVHRRLLSLTPEAPSFARDRIPAILRRRVIAYYKCIDAVTMRREEPHLLEVDHRFPQVRWSAEETLDPNMPEGQIRAKFQLMTRQNNLWKSRHCEHCRNTGERGTFPGMNFFAQGGPMWDPAIAQDDERGCLGCFWYDPVSWREALNSTLKR